MFAALSLYIFVCTLKCDPAQKAKWKQKDLPDTSDPVSNQLLTLNTALSHLSDDYDSLPNGVGSHRVEGQRRGGGRKRLSYVERSYNKLTNDIYTATHN